MSVAEPITSALVEDIDRGQRRKSLLRVSLLVGLTVVLDTLIGGITGEKTSYLLKNELHLTATALGQFSIVAGIPAYLQPFMGAVADMFPLFGYHRRSYFFAGAVVSLLSSLGFALLHQYHYVTILLLALFGGAGGVFYGVIFNAVMVAVGNRTGMFGRLQALTLFVPLVFTIAGIAHLGGYVAQHWSYPLTFGVAAALSTLYLPLVFLVEDTRVTAKQQVHETPESHAARMKARQEDRDRTRATLKQAMKTPGLWALVAYVFYLIITPGPNTFYYYNDQLHFSPQFIGDLRMWTAAGTMVGLGLFSWGNRKLPVVALVVGAWLADCLGYPLGLMLHDARSAQWLSLASAAIGVIYGLCLNTLAARACPPGIEGTIYGLILAAIALAGNLSGAFGNWLYDFFGPENKAHHYTLVHGWVYSLLFGLGFTLLAGLFIPFLPAWTRSRQPLQAGTGMPGNVETDEASESKTEP